MLVGDWPVISSWPGRRVPGMMELVSCGERDASVFLFTGVFGLVDRMPDLDAVICPRAVAGL